MCASFLLQYRPELLGDLTEPQRPQQPIELTADGKGARFDVYSEDDTGTVFDCEMQTTENRNLPKRSRYYQGMIDLNLIERGADYGELRVFARNPTDQSR